jgi:ABC-type Fe3+/spermidine/putrescine transport system ATPase subunit
MSQVVVLEGVTKRFAGRTVVDRLDLGVAKGEILALLGPSGCGKSTTLRMIAGLESVDAGQILLAGEVVSTPARLVAPELRRVGFVFQSFALFPHLSVEENVAFGAVDRGRIAELLALAHLEPRRAARIHTLSGGEQQRVALIRALAMAPRVVLLDEPFANLDAALRRHLREEIAQTLRARGATAIIVTHDASEAFALADHVAVMAGGALLQHGTPEDVYARPASLEIAARTGEIVRLAGRTTARGTVTTCLGELGLVHPPAGDPGERAVIAAARPEQLVVDPGGVAARVVRRVFEGASTSLELAIGDERLALRAAGLLRAAPGESIPVAIRTPVLVFPA